MPLASGTRLGAYELAGTLGAGGMGEVYRARDTRLKREVALKLLPEPFAQDPERLARFQREAEVLATLNHPHIASIYGLEETDGVRALVLELVDGGTLADRIARGPIPVDEALAIARQIAEALEAAHERGIIHRDLKPSNVAFTGDGQVKVLDFGLAKLTQAPGPGPQASELTASPTITTPALMTGAGVILGTAAYMSPEQAKGRDADKRSDLWAFGCVLFEMLTGRRTFEGEDVGDTLAAVLRADPDWAALPRETPAAIRTLLRSCLERDRRKRLADVAGARFVLDHTAQLVEAAPAPVPPGAAEAGRHVRAAAAAVISLVIGGASVWWWTRPLPPTVVRTTITAPESAALVLSGADRDIGITPDGSRVVYRGNNQLLVRTLDQLEPTVLDGLGTPRGVFIAPDSGWVGFFDGNTLKKVAVSGGPAVMLCRVIGASRGATWGDDGTVIFATADPTIGLQRVSAAGGDPAVLTKPDRERGESDHLFPEFLAGRDAVLFTITSSSGIAASENAQIAVLDLRTNTQKVLVRGGRDAQYVSTGHLVYETAGTLRAIAFDLARLDVIGTPVPIVANLASSTVGARNAAIAADGTLVYASGRNQSLQTMSTLVWVDRAGASTPLNARQAVHAAPRISPDGSRVAVQLSAQDGNLDIWVVDAERGTQTRLTSERSDELNPLWTPDGKRLTFSSNRSGSGGALYVMAADGSGAPEALTTAGTNQGATSWSPDGSTVAFYDVGGNYDIFTLKPGASPAPFLQTTFQERAPVFSPDGRWLAYSSNETGRPEIYVAPYPGPGGKIAISTGGGRSPRWSSNGRELFYRNVGQMLVVAVEPGPVLRIGTPRVLFEGDYLEEQEGLGSHNYDVSADGRRFLMMAPAPQERRETPPAQIVVVQNFFEELKRLAPRN